MGNLVFKQKNSTIEYIGEKKNFNPNIKKRLVEN